MKVTVYESIKDVDLRPLVFAGLIKKSVVRWRDVYIYYRNEVCNNQSEKDCRCYSVSNTADHFRISDRQVYNIIKAMEKKIDNGSKLL